MPIYYDVDIPDLKHGDISIGSRAGVEIITRVLRLLKTI